MKSLIDLIKSFDDAMIGKPSNEESIIEYETQLGLEFSEEYKEFLLTCGYASVADSELTGITGDNYDDVCVLTEYYKKQYDIPKDFYVIENLGIDDVIVWQNTEGKIFMTVGDNPPKQIKDSLYDYISSFEN